MGDMGIHLVGRTRVGFYPLGIAGGPVHLVVVVSTTLQIAEELMRVTSEADGLPAYRSTHPAIVLQAHAQQPGQDDIDTETDADMDEAGDAEAVGEVTEAVQAVQAAVAAEADNICFIIRSIGHNDTHFQVGVHEERHRWRVGGHPA